MGHWVKGSRSSPKLEAMLGYISIIFSINLPLIAMLESEGRGDLLWHFLIINVARGWKHDLAETGLGSQDWGRCMSTSPHSLDGEKWHSRLSARVSCLLGLVALSVRLIYYWLARAVAFVFHVIGERNGTGSSFAWNTGLFGWGLYGLNGAPCALTFQFVFCCEAKEWLETNVSTLSRSLCVWVKTQENVDFIWLLGWYMATK